MTAKRLTDGGTLEMLKIEGRTNAVLDKGQTPGVTYGVEWVKIDDPDPTFGPDTTDVEAIQAVGAQGRAKGAAIFSRLEGIFYDSGKVYLDSTQGGDTPAGEPPPAGYGDGFGQLWVYDTGRGTLTLLFESPSRTSRAAGQPLHQPAQVLAAVRGRAGRELPARGHARRQDLRLRAQRDRGPSAGGVRRLDLHARREGAVREHPGLQRPDVRDLGAVEARRALGTAMSAP